MVLLRGLLDIVESSGVLGPLTIEMSTALAILCLPAPAVLCMAMIIPPASVLTLEVVSTDIMLPDG